MPNLNRIGIVIYLLSFLLVGSVHYYTNLNFLSHEDALTYEKNARLLIEKGILAEYWDESLRAWRPHGLTLIIGAFYKTFGFSLWPIQVFYMSIYAATSTLMYYSVKELTNSYKAGALSTALSWLYIPFYLYAFTLITEHLMTFLMTLALHFLSHADTHKTRPKSLCRFSYRNPILLSGLVLGIGNWIKSNFLYLPLTFLPIVVIFSLRKANRWLLVSYLTFVTGIALATTPYLIRNYIAIGSSSRIVSYTGYNLYLGNYGLMNGDWENPSGSEYWSEFNKEYAQIKAELNSEVKVDDHFKKKTSEILLLKPTATLKKCASMIREQFYSGSGYEDLNFHLTRYQYLAYLSLSCVGVGAMLIRKLYIVASFSILTFLYNSLLIALTFSMNRFKEAIVPCSIIAAAFGIHWMITTLRSLCRIIIPRKGKKHSKN